MWQIIAAAGFVFLLLEIFAPGLFFLNFAISAFIVAIISVYIHNITVLVVVFSVLSIALIYSLRPLLIKCRVCNDAKTGIESKYIGKTAKVIEEIDKTKGVISLYDERWQARNIEEGIIEIGSSVKIVGNESIIMKVKKID